MWMWAPALACGNTFVLKPSEKDPSASLYVAELLQEAGVPDGVFNVVHGDKVAVDSVLEHPEIKAVSFVGSTPIAKYVYETATKHGKRCQALGGAKNHMIVLPDADIDDGGRRGGQCGLRVGRRALHGDLAGRGGRRRRRQADRRDQGSGSRRSRSATGCRKTRRWARSSRASTATRSPAYVASAADEGGKVVVDGRESAPEGEGFWLGVSLLDDLKPGMKAYDDEIFGPVLGVSRVDTYDEALSLVNENPYGNGTAIFTRDGGVARQFQFDVQAGMVGINVPIPVPVAYYSFGGWKSSLFGDTHIYGPEGISFYTRGKVVTSRWPDPATSKVDLGFPQTR